MISPVRATAALLLAMLAAGCAGDGADQFFVQPGRFDYLGCPEIATATQNTARREQELKILIERAQKEALGVILGEASYRGEYLKAQGELKMLAEVSARKGCTAQSPAATPGRPAAPAPARPGPRS